MTIKDIEADGYKIKQVMSKILIAFDRSNQVYIAHRFSEDDIHFTRPVVLGSAKRGFVKFMNTKGLIEKH